MIAGGDLCMITEVHVNQFLEPTELFWVRFENFQAFLFGQIALSLLVVRHRTASWLDRIPARAM